MAELPTQFENAMLEHGTPAYRASLEARRAEDVREAQVRHRVLYRAYNLHADKNTPEEYAKAERSHKRPGLVCVQLKHGPTMMGVDSAVTAVMHGAELL